MIGHITTLVPVRTGRFDACANWACLDGSSALPPPAALGEFVEGTFAAQQRQIWEADHRAVQLRPDQYGIESHVTNLCKDEIYLLSPNAVGLFSVVRC